MTMSLYRLLTAALVTLAISLPAAAQAPQPWTQVGSLMCKVNANIGFIIVGHQPMECTFSPTGGNPPQFYDGAINTIGIDVGVTEGSVLGWGVFAPTAGPMYGGLAGTYVGASGSIGVGVGVGANLLFGGTGRSIALQPLSVEGSVGINLSLGVSGLTLALAQ